MKIVGIDPGAAKIGYALMEGDRQRVRLLAAETIDLGRKSGPRRLALIEKAISHRLRRDRPALVAVEKLFVAGGKKTALDVAEARGVIILTASRYVPSIGEYAPSAVKLAVAGHGNAGKDALRRMVKAILPNVRLPPGDDAVDAVAIALTALALPAKSQTVLNQDRKGRTSSVVKNAYGHHV